MPITTIILRTLLFFLLTTITQIGGIIYLVSFFTHQFINNKASKRLHRVGLKFASFLALYCFATFLIVPILSKPFGRTALPLSEQNGLKPLNFLTCLLNRHYVRPELKLTTLEIAAEFSTKHPGAIINYLDANFPFFNGFPLIPHLSHNDGKKLDIAFAYLDKASGQPTNSAPSIIGYGICEEPMSHEVNTAALCARSGYWQYSFLKKIIPQGTKDDYIFDAARTEDLVNLFVSKPAIGKIFIEPHLKTRLKLTSGKVRFHGCRAVRHDDHIHVQLK